MVDFRQKYKNVEDCQKFDNSIGLSAVFKKGVGIKCAEQVFIENALSGGESEDDKEREVKG